jgi:hypothetical protein
MDIRSDILEILINYYDFIGGVFAILLYAFLFTSTEFRTALIVVNFVALFVVALTPKNIVPVRGTPPKRLCGIYVVKHLVITLVSGALVAYFSNPRPFGNALFWTVLHEFFLGQVIHIVMRVKTMQLYMLGLSQKPDGTGRLAEPQN